jgi:hypothetical protein
MRHPARELSHQWQAEAVHCKLDYVGLVKASRCALHYSCELS